MPTEPVPWITDEAFISPWTYEARKDTKLPKEVTIYDVTLRDGEQYPGLVFRKDDKIRLAEALERLGVKRIEVGMPAVGQEEVETIKEIVKRVRAHVTALCRAIRSDVDLAVEAGVWGVVIEVPANEILIKEGFLWDKKEVIQKVVDTCNYASSKDLYTICFLVDSSGADPDFLKSIVQEIVSKAHINSIVAVDTFGRQNPQGIKLFVKKMIEWSKLPVEIHAHNDFGLALANVLAAVEAGAEVIHTNFLGLGERSGMAATEEVAVALKFLYGLNPGLRLKKLVETAKIFQEVAKVTVPSYKPVVGENSFCYEVGGAAMFSYRFFKKGFPLGAVPYLPEAVGNEFKIVLGKKAGKFNVIWNLEKTGRSASEEQIKEMVNRIKDESLAKRRALTEEEFDRIYTEVSR